MKSIQVKDSKKRSSRRFRGLTLVEIVISMTIFFTGCLFIFKMFHSALLYSGAIGDDSTATVLAQKRLEEVRAWAYEQPSGQYNFNNSSWAAVEGTLTDPLYPAFKVTTSTALCELASPSHAVSGSVLLQSSARAVKVEVEWPSALGSRRISLVTLVAEPRRELNSIAVALDSSSLSLAPFESAQFSATAQDASGNAIDDIIFSWYVQPATGTGTVCPGGTPSAAVFTNQVIRPNGTFFTTVGTCKVYAIAQSGGIKITGYSPDIDLYSP